MDFPKACSSNLHVVENLGQTRFSIYIWKDDSIAEQEQRRLSQEIIGRLRHRNVLCSREEDRVWIFGDSPEEEGDLLLADYAALTLQDQGNIEEQAAKHTDEGRPVKEVLLDAIEDAIAFTLARDSMSLHVAPWTWLFCSREDEIESEAESVTMKLYTRFTPTGELYLVPELVTSEWLSLDHVKANAGSEVFITPYAKLANPLPTEDEGADIASGDSWRLQVRQALLPEGIQIEHDAQWKALCLAGDSAEDAFEWPVQLCVCRPRSSKIASVLGDPEWFSWFAGASNSNPFRNPLSSAEEWFLNAAAGERAGQEADQMVSSIGGTEESLGFAAMSMPQNGAAASLGTSPAFNQRQFEQQAAMAGIYPTPPDGLTQSQQMPNLNAVATPSVTQVEQGPHGADSITASDDAQFKGADLEISAEPEPYQMDQEDLFGDVGEMEFGDHEVDDADFSFFDEPDEDPVPTSVPDTDMLEAPLLEADYAVEESEAPQSDSKVSEGVVDELPASKTTDSALSEDLKHVPEEPGKLEEPAVSEASSSSSQRPRPEKPLSPFGIRERLLPPPVPASMTQHNVKTNGLRRKSSTFSPIAFRDSLKLDSKYADAHFAPESSIPLRKGHPAEPDISLPPTRKKSRLLKNDDVSDFDDSEDDSDNEDDSYESDSSENLQDIPPKLPWDNRKRKRKLDQDALSLTWSEMADLAGTNSCNEISQAAGMKIIEKCLAPYDGFDTYATRSRRSLYSSRSNASELGATNSVASSLPFIEDVHDLRKDDLICIAQIISEISITAFDAMASGRFVDTPVPSLPSTITSDSETLLRKAVSKLFPSSELCDIGKVASTREPPPRPATNVGKNPQGQPRPLQRSDSMLLGPDYFQLPAPYVRIQRGIDYWEMLPTSLSFWEQLGLAPVNGPKSVRAFCVFPNNDDLQRLVQQFIAELGTAFEGCRLGSHVHLRNVSEKNEADSYEDGMAPVELGDDISVEAALKAYAAECSDLGKTLSSLSHDESDRTIVIYMINPFRQPSAKQHLCACFWLLFKAYRDNLPKARRSQCNSDIVLQMLSIDSLASSDGIVVPNARYLATLAREVYDRCPPSPSSHTAENMSPLSILAAPSVELAGTAPKRIGFQLTAEPPGDLLHEGSVLHLAYATSYDGQWLTAAWIDSTGQHQSNTSFCLRGRSFADVAEDLWDRTRDIMAARPVTWRVFVLACGELDRATSQCWRTLSYKPRNHPTCVTLVSAQTEPALQLFAPVAAGEPGSGKEAQDVGFLTPASTPQANNFTSSPDIGNLPNTPLTPAPSETAASIVENDPDAHLTDITDETWGVLLSPKLTHLASSTGLANGLLFKRGDSDASSTDSTSTTGEKLPSLGVSLHWTIQVKPGGGVDEGTVRQSEMTLRELLKLYRNLALLTKSKGLDRGETSSAPLHAAMAIRGAHGLDGMLPPVVV